VAACAAPMPNKPAATAHERSALQEVMRLPLQEIRDEK
jgi:hypothetical protein